jgi:hypothetical protein
LCTVGEPNKLRILVPIAAYDYKLLTEDMAALGPDGQLDVRMRISGSATHIYHGKLRRLPAADAKTVPVQLTFKGGGSLAAKPAGAGSDPNNPEPQSQVYLVEVEIDDPDPMLVPGSLPRAKIQCRWRTLAWYVWRKIHISFDVSL